MVSLQNNEWVFMFAPIVTGYLASAVCGMSKDSGSSVKFRPPGWVFGIMWPILYLLLGIAWVASSRKNSLNSIPYAVLTALLVGWILTYSCAENVNNGVFVILAAVMCALVCFSLGPKISKICIAPLIGWLIFAMMMNAVEVQETK